MCSRPLNTEAYQKCRKENGGYFWIHSSFSQLDNSGSSAISIKSKGLTNVKIYVERTVFFKRLNLITRPPITSSAAGLALFFLLTYYFWDNIKVIVVLQNIDINNSLLYFNILDFCDFIVNF